MLGPALLLIAGLGDQSVELQPDALHRLFDGGGDRLAAFLIPLGQDSVDGASDSTGRD